MSSLANLRNQAEGDEQPAIARQSSTPNWYCLDKNHSPMQLTEDRLFYFDGTGCPVCPVCQKQVVAQEPSYNAKGQPLIPASMLGMAGRLGEAVPY